MARWKETLVVLAPVAALGFAIAAAPAADQPKTEKRPTETNEQIVADFLARKGRAETAQRAIVGDLRRALDQRRADFEEARRKFDDARGRYAEITGPLVNTRVVNPTDPRLPYEFELRRSASEPSESGRSGVMTQRGAETRAKAVIGVEAPPK
jgi:hypothetical protein